MTTPERRDITTGRKDSVTTLRALASPVRLRILSRLRTRGAATASILANEFDDAIGSISHHLKQLAAGGLIEEEPELARDARERWWKPVRQPVSWSMGELRDDPDALAAGFEVELALAAVQEAQYRDFLQQEADDAWDEEWMDAAATTDFQLELSPEMLRHLHALILERVRALEVVSRDHRGDESCRPVAIQFRAFPLQR